MASATAEQLLRELGPEAIDAVSECIEECRRLGEEASARFWLGVKAELEGLAAHAEDDAQPSNGDPGRDVYFRRRRWMLMQKAELHRRRAMEAERLAGRWGDQQRQEMLDIALQWFELARQYEWLAEAL